MYFGFEIFKLYYSNFLKLLILWEKLKLLTSHFVENGLYLVYFIEHQFITCNLLIERISVCGLQTLPVLWNPCVLVPYVFLIMACFQRSVFEPHVWKQIMLKSFYFSIISIFRKVYMFICFHSGTGSYCGSISQNTDKIIPLFGRNLGKF